VSVGKKRDSLLKKCFVFPFKTVFLFRILNKLAIGYNNKGEEKSKVGNNILLTFNQTIFIDSE